MNKIGLIAGNGNFPIAFARAAKEKGLQVIVVAHEGETLPELAQLVDGDILGQGRAARQDHTYFQRAGCC